MRNLHFVFQRASMFIFHSAIIFVCIGLIACSCKQADEIQQEVLYGRWDITKAERNGKETSYLRGGYFIIGKDSIMTINITGEDERGKYRMENNKLLMEGNRTFDIQSLRKDSLTIRYAPESNSEFLFYMLKKTEDVQ